LEEAGGESIEDNRLNLMHPLYGVTPRKVTPENRWLAFIEHYAVDTITKMTELTSDMLCFLSL
jgi:hypothetical protein